MPIDPGIALSVRPPQVESPIDALQKATSIQDMVAQLRERQASAADREAQAPLRQQQLAAQVRQYKEQSALNSAFENSVTYDSDAGDLNYDDKKASQTLHDQGMDYLLPQYQSQKDQRRAAHRTQTLGELTNANAILEKEAVPAENFLSMDADKRSAAWPELRTTLLTTDPKRGKILPEDYDSDTVDSKLQELVDAHEQTKDVAAKLSDAQNKERLQSIADTKLSVEDLWKKKGGAGDPTSQFRNAVIAQRSGVPGPAPASYVDKPATTKSTPGHQLPVNAVDENNDLIPDEQRIDTNFFQATRRGADGTTYYRAVAGSRPTTQQSKDQKAQAGYAFTIGKDVADLTPDEKVKADAWYTKQLPEKQTEIDKRLALYTKSPDVYAAIFGHGGAGADKPITSAQKATILGRINSEYDKAIAGGASTKEASGTKAQRVQELKDAGIDVTTPAPAAPAAPKPAVPATPTALPKPTPQKAVADDAVYQAYRKQYGTHVKAVEAMKKDGWK